MISFSFFLISVDSIFFDYLQIYNTSQLNKKTIHRAIQGAKSLVFYKDNPRMVPEGLHPACHKMAIVVPVYKPQNKSKLTAMSSIQAGSNKKSSSSDGFLTDAELRYWSEHLKVADADVPRIPESEIICLLILRKLVTSCFFIYLFIYYLLSINVFY